MIRRLSLVLIAVAALMAPSSAGAAPKTLDVSPQQLAFGEQPFHTFATQAFTVRNVSKKTIAVSVESAFVPDDFSHLIFSTCGLGDRTLAAGESCTHVVGFRPTEYFAGLETATVVLNARDQATGTQLVTRTVEITGTGV